SQIVGLNFEASSATSELWLYNQSWGLNVTKGDWTSGRNGFLGISPDNGPVRITFNTALVSGVGGFVNYPRRRRAATSPSTPTTPRAPCWKVSTSSSMRP